VAGIGLNCPYCGAENAGFTFVALTKRNCGDYNVAIDRNYVCNDDEERMNSFWTCNICAGGITITVKPIATLNLKTVDDVGFWGYYDPLNVYPSNNCAVAPTNTPPEMAKVFVWGANLLNREDFEGCALKMRRILDMSHVGYRIPGEKIKDRIERLVKDGLIQKCLADWAEQFRQFESEELHGFRSATKEEVHEYVAFTELFLTCMYTIPAILKKRGKPSKKSSSAPDNTLPSPEEP
jgi:hypothetical protein